jgi:hypothetical protein
MNDEPRDRKDDGSGDEAEASPEELAAAARLRDALEGGAAVPDLGASDELRLARALPHVLAPRDLDPEVHARLIDEALAGRQRPARRGWRRAAVVSASLGGVLAMAASVLLLLSSSRHAASAVDSAAMNRPAGPAAALVPRSTEPLFVNEQRPLPHRGSARIDRIASARSGEYLQARLTRWGAQ